MISLQPKGLKVNNLGLGESQLNLIKNVFAQYDNLEKAVVFGSRAKGNFRQYSDIDLALFGDLTSLDAEGVKLALEELPLIYKFDVLSYNELKNQALKEHIDRVGVEIYSTADKWRKVKLGEVCVLISRGATPSYIDTSNCYILNQKCIKNGRISYDNTRYHDTNKKQVSEEKKISNTDTLICSTGVGTLGRVGRFYEEVRDLTTVDSHVMIVRPKDEVDSTYLNYTLISMQNKIETLGEGSTGQTELSRSKLSDLNLLLPTLLEQQKIADVLGSLDDKIEANNRQNKTLEAIAQALFKSWFVDFEPVKAKSEGKQLEGLAPEISDLFPSSFVDSSLGKIPEGWEVKKLDEFAPFAYGRTLPVESRNLGNVPVYGSSGIIGYNNVSYINSAGIIIGRKGTVGTVDYSIEPFWPIDTTFYVVDEPQKRDFMFTYYTLRAIRFDNSDSAVPGLNRDNAHSKKLITAPVSVQKAFSSLLSDLHNKIILNKKQSQTLASIRDLLLPRLISGRVQVKEF
ncbi:MAG: restriction endonuclease subunit S [Holosporaceae bacterium]|jgi:type I restriction enzyme S subunit|nr:restriction endonuclease subunit S [Holosporaceae bacterium]